jgi:hypothetical protein
MKHLMKRFNFFRPSRVVGLKRGLLWGLGMYVGMEIIWPFFTDETFIVSSLYVALPFWLMIGGFFGLAMEEMRDREKTQQEHRQS